MRFLAGFALPALASALLLLAPGDARADVCFGGPHPDPVLPDSGTVAPDAGTAADGGSALDLGGLRKQLGGGFLAAAVMSTGWLCFRRKGDGAKE